MADSVQLSMRKPSSPDVNRLLHDVEETLSALGSELSFPCCEEASFSIAACTLHAWVKIIHSYGMQFILTSFVRKEEKVSHDDTL